MKIKAVCKVTGLTDRTIRFYIEEGLITPSYTESYTGRKAYDFSPATVSQLHKISTLRQFGFSIEEIRELMQDPQKSKQIIQNVRHRAGSTYSEKQSALSVLEQLDENREYPFSELAAALSCAAKKEQNAEKPAPKTVCSILKSVLTFIIVLLPAIVCAFICHARRHEYYYSGISFQGVCLTLVTLLPSILVVVLSRFQFPRKKVIKRCLLVLCVLLLPFNVRTSTGIITRSETRDLRHYLKFDVNCPANRNIFLRELFPRWPNYANDVKQPDGTWKTVDADATYHYRRNSSASYDVYAQWKLSPEEFDAEVARVTALFAQRDPDHSDYTSVQRGDYVCIIAHSGSENGIFEEVDEKCTYYKYDIFAYDSQSLTVRYISCYRDLRFTFASNCGQPCYLSLDW